MLDVELLRNEPDQVKIAIKTKATDPSLVDDFIQADKAWRMKTKELEKLRAEQNELSKARNIEVAKANKEKIKVAEGELEVLAAERLEIWQKIPNLPSADTPIGANESGNKVIRKMGEPRQFDFEPKDHVALGEALGLINIESAGKVSGTRFAYLMGDAVLLEFALTQYALEILTNPKIIESIAKGVKPDCSTQTFVPVLPPALIRPEVFQKMARLEPKEERYYIPSDNLYLVGSAEHTLGPMHMDEIIPEGKLPLRYLGFSTAFRREAGSYGQDTRGILRVHQFDKLEMESFCLPENGLAEQDFFVAIQEYFVWSLELPYQVVAISTGDMGGPDHRQIDIETWLPSQRKYRETHTADYMTDYQARRLNTRVKRKNGSLQLVHMNDATAFAGRTLIAIMENYQTKDGKIQVPQVLQKYVGKKIIG